MMTKWGGVSPYHITTNYLNCLTLQGSSGTGYGNFMEIGPLDINLKPRYSTWLQKADLMFVVSLVSNMLSRTPNSTYIGTFSVFISMLVIVQDNPVGTGYSYVEDPELTVKTDDDAAIDLTTLLVIVFSYFQELQSNNLYLVAESYGGKYAVTTGLKALEAIKAGRLKINLGGG